MRTVNSSKRNTSHWNDIWDMEHIITYLSHVSEALKNPVDIRWIEHPGQLIGLFIVNDNVYQLTCTEKREGYWKYKFHHVEKREKYVLSPELTGISKDRWRVLPTVKKGLEHLVETKKVTATIFGATDSSKGRKKLYESFCENFSKEQGFRFFTRMEDDRQIYILYRPDTDPDILQEVTEEIISEEK